MYRQQNQDPGHLLYRIVQDYREIFVPGKKSIQWRSLFF